MTHTELQNFQQILEREQSEVRAGTMNREVLAVDTSPDELDRIQHASERDYVVGNLERNAQRLREVREALGRLEQGTFGVCLDCEEDISAKRLAAVPWASRCIVCQESADRRQKTDFTDDEESFEMAA